MIDIALYQPDIAQKRGYECATCGLSGADHSYHRAGRLRLECPGFSGAPVWIISSGANVVRQPSWEVFLAAMSARRIVLATTQAEMAYTDFGFQADDIILVGRESAGVPDHVRDGVTHTVSIPMQPGTRSLNVAVATAMITGEALRQTAWHTG